MSALAEALLAAQRTALGSMQKAYVRGSYENVEDFLADAERIGCTDKTDLALFVNALDTIRLFGGEVSQPPNGTPKEDRPASDAQWKLIRHLADERGQVAPDGPLTVEQASKLIEQLKAGA